MQEKERFKENLKFVLKWEGGYTHHPNDPGGPTNMGITQSVYDAYRKEKKLPPRHVKDITREEVEEIYFTRYYVPSKAPLLPPPLDLVVFDTAVNMGVKTSAILLQKALKELGVYPYAVDGTIGNLTLEAVNKAVSEKGMATVVKKYIELRNLRYHEIANKNPKLKVFLRGWLNRTSDLLAHCVGKSGSGKRSHNSR